MPTPPPKLLDDTREVLRARHYAYRTEQRSIDWMRRGILFHQKRHPRDMGRPEIEAFLIHLATEQHVAASTQNQARSAILSQTIVPCQAFPSSERSKRNT